MRKLKWACGAAAGISILAAAFAEDSAAVQRSSSSESEQLSFRTENAKWVVGAPKKGKQIRQVGVFDVKDSISSLAAPDAPLLAPRFEIRSANGVATEEDFVFDSVRREKKGNGVVETSVVMKSTELPVVLTLRVRAFAKEDVFRVRSELRNIGKEKLQLLARDAASIFLGGETTLWIATFKGGPGHEMTKFEETRLGDGASGNLRLSSSNTSHNSQSVYPALIASLDGRTAEEAGRILVLAFGWDGDWQTQAEVLPSGTLLSAGALEDSVDLEPGETYVSPPAFATWSSKGMGEASRNLHRYMRRWDGIRNPDKVRPVVLNSWEGIGMNVSEQEVRRMIRDAASLGAEMFVLDDGWFGGKHQRTDHAGLGDWKIDARKLPNGFAPLIEECRKNGMRFGLWFEPEMVNPKSELYEKHPDWIIQIPGKEQKGGLWRHQFMLDLAKPEVREYVYHAVADILKANPGIEYVKWDHNQLGFKGTDSDLHNNNALKIMARLRKEFPKVMFQLCASGGGRADVGTMRFFEEFWPSDETNGARRIPIQWGFSHFFPSNAIASHVNKHGPACSYKFRADVAMTGRMGVELRPADLKGNDLDAIRRGIAAYKKLRPLLHSSDLYRGRSPHASSTTELTFVSEDKRQAALFAFRRGKQGENGESVEVIRPSGLAPKKTYRLIEQNPDDKPRIQSGVAMTGEELMKKGVSIKFQNPPSSAVILMTETSDGK